MATGWAVMTAAGEDEALEKAVRGVTQIWTCKLLKLQLLSFLA